MYYTDPKRFFFKTAKTALTVLHSCLIRDRTQPGFGGRGGDAGRSVRSFQYDPNDTNILMVSIAIFSCNPNGVKQSFGRSLSAPYYRL